MAPRKPENIVDPIPGEFDEVVDAVLGVPKPQPPPRLIEPKPADDAVLYAGDCLHVLTAPEDYVPDGSVDLIYIDPPWNTGDYYLDIWKDSFRVMTYEDMKDIGTYIKEIEPRIRALHKKLKPTGSFYLHCDEHAGHYLKVLCDRIFDERNFRSEITWQRTTAHSDAKHQWPDVTDKILFYAKGPKTRFYPQFVDYDPAYVKKEYSHDDGEGRGPYALHDMSSPQPRPNLMYDWKGYHHPEKGWRYDKRRMKELDGEGRIYFPKTLGGHPDYSKRLRLKRYLREQRGKIVTNIWTDISPVQGGADEDMGYPTQKPLKVLERIIRASSKTGDLVLDAYCGCGTTIEAAHRLGRKWIGIDSSYAACRAVAEDRLGKRLSLQEGDDFYVWGTDLKWMNMAALQRMTPNEFEGWAIATLNGIGNEVKQNDGGIDGRYYPIDRLTYKQIRERVVKGDVEQRKMFERLFDYRPIQVKKHKTKVGRPPIADFREAMRREERRVGYFVSLRGFTKDALRTIRSLHKKEGMIIVPATAQQMVEGKKMEIQTIHRAPEAFDDYLEYFLGRAA